MARFDILVRGRLVLPEQGLIDGSVGVKDGKILALSRDIPSSEADEVLDAKNGVVFPGAVDSHFHIGIYRPHREDAISESKAAATGGVTTILSYLRTGRHYLETGGPYAEVYPRALELSRGAFHVDYGYHLAPITETHLEEMSNLLYDHGVNTFKYYMFYKGLELKGEYRAGRVEREYLLSENPYDLGHLYSIMTTTTRLNKNGVKARVSVHCEDSEIIRATATAVRKAEEDLPDLEAYSRARPPTSECIAIAQAVYVAKETGCPLNLLHLSSMRAVETASALKAANPGLDLILEVTGHHLALTTDNELGVLAKVNPPIRGKEDVEALWRAIKAGWVNTIASDHACLPANLKTGDIWTALPGFAGTTVLFPIVISEGFHRRGVTLERICQLLCYNPAVIHGLYPKKGAIALGFDADFTIVDLDKTQKVEVDLLNSAQDYTPFQGMELKGWPVKTLVRGNVVYEDGQIVGKPGDGRYIKRPVTYHKS